MVKLKNIAEKLGLGVSTVSAVLNDKTYCYVSKEKKELIRKVAREMGYVPNRMSRGIQGLSTNMVGIITHFTAVPVMNELLRQLNIIFGDHNYYVLHGDSRNSAEREKIIIGEFLSRGIDGLIIENCLDPAGLEKTVGGRVPYICMTDFDGPTVTVDRKDGMERMTDHLIEAHGHRSPVFLSRGPGTKKYEGFCASLAKHGISAENTHLFLKDAMHPDELVPVLRERNVSAVVCSSDLIAGFLVRTLAEAGLRVPEDMAVTGFDGLEIISELIRPPLTTVVNPVGEIAQCIYTLLMKKIQGEHVENKTVYIRPQIRLRRSCGCM